MPRYSVIASNGRTIAKGIYHLPFLELIGCNDGHSLAPAGSFILDRDLERAGWISSADSGIYLSHQDIFDFPREGQKGCCGPNGDKNILDPDTLEPIAYEFADCYSSHYVRLARGDYSLKEESPENPICMVGYVEYRGMRQLVGAACGRNKKEANARLLTICERQRKMEAHYTSQYHVIIQLPIEREDASVFLAQLHKKRPHWLFLKY